MQVDGSGGTMQHVPPTLPQGPFVFDCSICPSAARELQAEGSYHKLLHHQPRFQAAYHHGEPLTKQSGVPSPAANPDVNAQPWAFRATQESSKAQCPPLFKGRPSWKNLPERKAVFQILSCLFQVDGWSNAAQ